MPQIDQAAHIFASQFFWLAVVFALIYFGIGRGMLPKIEATMDARANKIAGDLAAAERARAAADTAEAGYRERMERNRAEAARTLADAKSQAAAASETRVKAADAALNERAAAAMASLNARRDEAIAGLEPVAVDAARDIVARLAGIDADEATARAAVQAAREVRA